MSPVELSGELVFDAAAPAWDGARVAVVLEEVTRADAASTEVARIELDDVAHAPGGAPLPFALVVPELDPDARYELRAHVDMDGSGVVARGDQVSTESIPVASRGSPDHVQIRVHTVG